MGSVWKLGLKVPRLVILLCLLASFAAASGIPRLTLSSDSRVFFDPQSPELVELEHFEQKFGQNNGVLMVVSPHDLQSARKVTDPDILAVIGELTKRAWKLPHSTRVESLTNFPHVTSDADSFSVEELVPDPSKVSAAKSAEVEKIATTDRLVVNRLISPDAKVAGVLINFNLPEEGSRQVREIIAASRVLASDIEKEHPDINVRLTGNVMLLGTFAEAAVSDALLLIPVSLLVSGLIMMLFVRSVRPSLAIISLLVLSSMSAMGLAGWLGYVINPASIAAPIIIVTVNMAAAVRIVTTTMTFLGRGETRHDAIAKSLAIHIRPVSLTTFTSAIGFLSMNLAEAPPFRDLGNLVAMGILFAYVLTFTWLPAILIRMDIMPAQSRSERFMIGLGRFVNANYRFLFLLCGAVVIASGFWLHKITLDDDFARYFDGRFQYRQDSDFAEAHLTGLNIIEFDVGAGSNNGVYQPAYQRKLEDFLTWLRAQPHVVSVIGIPDITRRIEKAVKSGTPDSVVSDKTQIPDDADSIAQYFLLYELSLPYGASLNDQINVSRSSSRVTAILRNVKSSEIRGLNRQAQAWLAANAPPAMAAKGISINVLFSNVSWINIRSMIGATITSMLVIAIIVGLALRSVGYGLLSIVMNIFPSIVGFGIWGLLIGQIGLAASVITAMTIGLVVDDTIYFLMMYRAARTRGLNSEEAINEVFEIVGTAMLVITLSLAVGFGVLIASGFEVNRSLGAQTTIVILANLFIDWLMLPPLLRLIDRDKKRL